MLLNKIGLISYTCHQPSMEKVVTTLKEWMDSHQESEIFTCLELPQNSPALFPSVSSEKMQEMDLLIAVGGDGTFLTAARLSAGKEIPILGVHTGTVGFLTDFPASSLAKALKDLETGDFDANARTMLDCHIEGQPDKVFSVLNEIHLRASHPERIAKLEVQLNDGFLTEYWADSLLVSTPTGSTAYNLSAGGPIIHPANNALVINPVSPTSLSVRPLVIPDTMTVRIAETHQEDIQVILDGQKGALLRKGEVLIIQKSQWKTIFIQSRHFGFFDALRQKLGWNGRPNVPEST